MTRTQRLLVLFLRITALVEFVAVVPMVMPISWMDAAHRALGMGPLPDGRIVGYLARSTCALYAMHGAFFWYASTDIHRHARLIDLLAAMFLVFGAAMLGIDLAEQMPWYWVLSEGPWIIGLGVVYLGLNRAARLRRRNDVARITKSET